MDQSADNRASEVSAAEISEPRSTRASKLPGVTALLYHHVGHPKPGTEHLGLTVTPERFHRQVRWLHFRGYRAITPSQWLRYRNEGKPLPRKCVMFTFDDAYQDLGKYGLPILERYGFPSVVFAISRRMGEIAPWDGMPLMNIDEILEWSKRGVEFGAHTRTHPNLVSLPDASVIEEVQGCKQDMAAIGLDPNSFAYPHGEFDARIRSLVAGVFPLAFTCEEGVNDITTDPLLLKRTMVQPSETVFDVEVRAALGRSPVHSIRSKLRIRSRFRQFIRGFAPRSK